MSSTWLNGISLWSVDTKDEKIDGVWEHVIIQYPVLCPCGFTRKIGAGIWQPEKKYYPLQCIISSIDNNFIYKCINAGGKTGEEMPVWNIELNTLTTDGDIVWQCLERPVASYFYDNYFWLCPGCGKMLVSVDDDEYHNL